MFFGLYKKKEKNFVPSATKKPYVAGGMNIHYNPDLIEGMKADHVNLLNIYTDIQAASEAKNFKKVAIYLDNFRTGLEDHLLKENTSLYIYLAHLLKGDAMNSELITKFRKEMDGIASVALKFLAKYESIGEDSNLHECFSKEFANIGKVLGARIKREEKTLYTLYLPPY